MAYFPPQYVRNYAKVAGLQNIPCFRVRTGEARARHKDRITFCCVACYIYYNVYPRPRAGSGQLEIFPGVNPSKRRVRPRFRARSRALGSEHQSLLSLRFRAISEDFYKRAHLAFVYPSQAAAAPGAQGLGQFLLAQVDIWSHLSFYLPK